MRNGIFLLLILLAPFLGWPEQAGAAVSRAEHVIIIGVDGLGAEGVRKGSAPNLDRMMKEGAFTLHARGVLPTSSSPNWASMIMGAGPEQHGVTSNDWQTNKFEIPPVAVGSGGIFPTVFGVLREQRPDSVIACFHDWEGFGRLFERNAPNEIRHVKDAIETTSAAIKYWKEKKPNFLFLHLDGVDHAGHGFGWSSVQYFKELEMVDSLIGAMVEAVAASGLKDKTIILVTADHGGKGTGHGGATLAEIEIPWILTGAGVAPAKEIKSSVNTYDTAATVAYIFGLKPPACWIGRPVLEAFQQ